nr:ribonuclease H-like domain, reverse transcriptase, RNA-dependent DNA polymerase [Tanacetum cinerariifolium]
MVAILEKGEFNTDFHPMVDFIAASPLRYTLTVKPTIYVSHIRQFWSTARIETMDEGTHILATVDGIQRTMSEASLRRNLKLRDEDGIVSISDMELFENLTLMGYNISQNQKLTFQKGQFSHQWKYLIHTIMQCLSPKSTGFNEFSSNIATALVCLATNRTYNFSKMIFDGMVKNVNNKISKFLMYPRIVPLFDTMLVHQGEGSGTPTEPDHTPFPEIESSHPTTSLILLPSIPTAPIPIVTQPDPTPIKQYSRRVRIAQSFALPTIADEPASPVRDVSEGEACPTASGFITDQDMATIAKTSTLPHDSAPRVTSPAADEGKDREGVATKPFGEDSPIKGRSNNEWEAAAERISNDSEEIARVLTSIDAATVLAGEIDVPTGSGFIPTAGTPATVSQQRRPMTKKQKREYYMAVIKSNLGWRFKDFKGMTFEEIEVKFAEVWKQVEDFIPIGSKEEIERLKRKGLNLEKEQVKKQKSSKEAPEIESTTKEFTEEKIKEMIQLVPVEDVYVQAL